MSTAAKPVVFLGPTLSRDVAASYADAVHLPPAALGDIIAAVETYRPPAILVIDGAFQNAPAVRHREILWALSRGIPVLGAASMGALRAAELWQYGMIGVGLIYRWYRRFPFCPDDAVAVLHGPQELGFIPLTHAAIDLQLGFRRAERQRSIDESTRRALVAATKALHFRDRTLEKIVQKAVGNGPRSENIFNTIASQITSQKRSDAIVALKRLAGSIALPANTITNVVITRSFARDLGDSRLHSSG